MPIKYNQYILKYTYLKKKDPNADGVELTIIVKDKTGVEKIVNELFGEDNLAFAGFKDNKIIILEHELNRTFVLDKIDKLLCKLEGNIEDRYFRKVRLNTLTKVPSLP